MCSLFKTLSRSTKQKNAVSMRVLKFVCFIRMHFFMIYKFTKIKIGDRSVIIRAKTRVITSVDSLFLSNFHSDFFQSMLAVYTPLISASRSINKDTRDTLFARVNANSKRLVIEIQWHRNDWKAVLLA